MRMRKYFFKFDFWMQILIMIIITILLVFITIFMLRIITRHGEKIKVPDMSGYTIEELKPQTAQFGFQYIVRDSVYKRNAKAGTIIAQSPEAGSFVKQDRKFYLTTAAATPPYVKMPNLKDLSLRQAKSLLETYNIKIGRVTTVPSVGKAIVEQYYKGKKISPGEEIPHGSVITLEVGSGSSSDGGSGSDGSSSDDK